MSNQKSEYHNFDKIRNIDVLSCIFTFFHISEINTLFSVCKRFRHHFWKDDSYYLRIIGNYSYAWNRRKPFLPTPSDEAIVTSLKSNIFVIMQMCWLEDYQYVVITPSTFENGLFVWDVSSGIFQYSIIHTNDWGKKCYVYSMIYIREEELLIVAYSDNTVYAYKINEPKKSATKKEVVLERNYNPNERYIIKWHRVMSWDKPVKDWTYNIITDSLFTLETVEEIGISFIKEFSISEGKLKKSSVITNYSVLKMKCFSIDNIEYNSSNNKEEYLVLSWYEIKPGEKIEMFNLGVKETKIGIKNLSSIEGNLKELNPDINLYGHTSQIKNFTYNTKYKVLISVGIDLYIIFWDLINKTAKYVFDSKHEDIINSITNINDDIFATCGKDRNVFIWSIPEIFKNSKEPLDSIVKHSSDIYEIIYNSHDNSLITGSFDKTLRSFQLSKSSDTIVSGKKLSGHYSTITAVGFDFLKSQIITAGLDQSWIYWDLNSMKVIKTIDFKQKECFDDFIMLFDDISTVIKIDNTKKVKCWNGKTEEFYHVIEEKDIVRSILNFYDGVSFALGLSNGDIAVYNYKSQPKQRVFKLNKKLYHSAGEEITKNVRIKKLCYIDYNTKHIASCGNNGSICVFGLDYREPFKHFIPGKKNKDVVGICSLGFTNKKKEILYAIEDTIYSYDWVSGCFLYEHVIGKLTSFDKLNNRLLIWAWNIPNTEPMISEFDIEEKKIVKNIKLAQGNIRPCYYLQNNHTIIAVNGSPTTGFGIDVVTFDYNKGKNEFD